MSGDVCTYFHVCIQSVVRGFHVYKAVWTPVGLVHTLRGSIVGVKKLLINFWDISLHGRWACKLKKKKKKKKKKHMGSKLIKRQEKGKRYIGVGLANYAGIISSIIGDFINTSILC